MTAMLCRNEAVLGVFAAQVFVLHDRCKDPNSVCHPIAHHLSPFPQRRRQNKDAKLKKKQVYWQVCLNTKFLKRQTWCNSNLQLRGFSFSFSKVHHSNRENQTPKEYKKTERKRSLNPLKIYFYNRSVVVTGLPTVIPKHLETQEGHEHFSAAAYTLPFCA